MINFFFHPFTTIVYIHNIYVCVANTCYILLFETNTIYNNKYFISADDEENNNKLQNNSNPICILPSDGEKFFKISNEHVRSDINIILPADGENICNTHKILQQQILYQYFKTFEFWEHHCKYSSNPNK